MPEGGPLRLRTLRLQNYRRFPQATIEFPEGLIAIVGPNGAGKSTLIEAIAWALYGHDAARTGKDLLKRAEAAPGEDVVVHVEFEIDHAAYVVTRRLRGKTLQSEAQVACNGALVVSPGANSSDQATQYLSRLLGMDRSAFLVTVVAKQGDLAALNDHTPSRRKQLILGMLGVDEVEEAIRRVRAQKREHAIRLTELRRFLTNEEDLRRSLATAERDLEQSQSQRERLETEITQRRATTEQCSQEVRRLGEAQARHRELRSRLEALQRTHQVLKTQQSRLAGELQLVAEKQAELRRLETDGQRFANLDERWEAARTRRGLHEERRRREDALHRIEEDLERWQRNLPQPGRNGHRPDLLEQEISTLHAHLEQTIVDLSTLEGHSRHVASEQHRLQSEASRDQERWRTVQELGPQAPCPTCDRPLGDAVERLAHRAAEDQTHLRGRVEELQSTLQDLSARAESLSRARDETKHRITDRERTLQSLRRRLEEERVAQQELERLETARTKAAADLAALPPLPPAASEEDLERDLKARGVWRERVAQLREAVQREPRLRDELLALQHEGAKVRAETETLSRELGLLAYRDGAWEEARLREEAERRRLHEEEQRLTGLRERARGLAEQRERLRTEAKQLEEIRARAVEAEAATQLGELLASDHGDQGVLPEFKNYLIARIRPALARTASHLVQEMTQGRYVELRVDEDYGIQLYDGGNAWPLERFSGGEGDVVNLALRLSVSELVARARRSSRVEFVALDEVLASQDVVRRDGVLAALKALGRHFRQVLLVTHIDEVRDRVDHVIQVSRDGNGSSRLQCSWNEKD